MSFELRRTRWLGAAGAVALGYVAVVALVPVDYVMSLAPGPTFNTIGEADGTPLIEIRGRETYPTAGSLDMTTVSERGGPFGGMYVSRVLLGWRDPQVRMVPSDLFYPRDVPTEEIEQANQADFVGSQSTAVSAALVHLGIPGTPHVMVAAVQDTGPAHGRLEPGDEIRSVNGVAVDESEQVGQQVRAHPVGSTVRFVVERDGNERVVEVQTAAGPDGAPFVGISVQRIETPPFDVEFTLEDVGGPSAGLMFSLGLVDKLTPGYLNGGKEVAGTGTISGDGAVGPIGGIEQKLYGAQRSGATLFLAPRDNCSAVRGNVPEGLTVAAVTTLDEAVAALADYAAGRPVPTC